MMRKAECKIRGKPGHVSLYLLVKSSSKRSKEPGQIGIEKHFLSPQDNDAPANDLGGNWTIDAVSHDR